MKTYYLFALFVLCFPFHIWAQEQFSQRSMQNASNYSDNCGGATVLIMQNGKIVFEAYHNGADSSTATHIHSATKFFWAAAAALAVQQGLISSFEEPVVNTITEWEDVTVHPGKKLIRVKHLLQLSSGLSQDVEQIQGNNPKASNIYQYVVDSLNLNASPGRFFQYGPSHYFAFGVILERKLHNASRMISPLKYLESEIFDSIGFEYESWIHDPAGNAHIPNGCYVTARNWVKFGQFMLQEGRWGNSQIIDSNLVKDMYITMGPNLGHGNFCWLNKYGGQGTSPAMSAPAGSPGGFIYYNGFTDIIGAMGAGKNRMYLIPSLNAVVLRQTMLENDTFNDHTFLSYLLDPFVTGYQGQFPQQFLVYPNPAKSSLILSGLPYDFNGTIAIYNTLGQIQFAELKTDLQFSLEVGHLKTGIYFLQIKAEDGQIITRKFLKI